MFGAVGNSRDEEDEQEDEESMIPSEEDEEDEEGPTCSMPSEPMPDNVYGFVMASLIKDSADIKVHGVLKLFRICTALVLYALMFGMQVYLLAMTKSLVSPVNVAEIREEYDYFQKVMYTDDAGVSQTVDACVGGCPRGVDGFFKAANFAKLGVAHQEAICQVPLSKAHFLFTILFIWLLSTLTHVKQAVNFAIRIIWLPLVSHDEAEGCFKQVGRGTKVVGMPLWLKGIIVVVILIPRIILALFMAWLGMRWLAATLGFSDLLLNALALVFIFDLSELMYSAMVPHHSKLLVQRTLIPHLRRVETENYRGVFGMFALGLVSALIAYLYMHYGEHVLPAYKWDVSQVCTPYLAEKMAVITRRV